MTVVAISAAYGAAGSRIGQAVAQRLGVPFLDRAIPAAVAEQLDVPYDEAAAHDQRVSGNWLERMLQGFVGGDTGTPVPVPAEFVSGDEFRRATEQVLLTQAASGEGVILGRGSVFVLRDDPRVLRVRLDGPPRLRIDQAMRVQGVGRDAAEAAARRLDRMHSEYARRFYGSSLGDLALYHLVIDSTSIDIDVCVELIVAAARGLGKAGSRRA